VEGNEVPALREPLRTPSRSARSSWSDSVSGALRLSSTSTSGARLLPDDWSTKPAPKWTLTPSRDGSSLEGVKLRALLVAPAVVLVAVTASAAATGTPQVVARIKTGSRPCSEVGGFGAVWVGNNGGGTLARINPKTNKVTGKVRVGAGPCGVA